MEFTKEQIEAINRELKSRDSLVTKDFITIAKRKGKWVEVWRDKKTGKLEEMRTNAERLRFKLKVAQSRKSYWE